MDVREAIKSRYSCRKFKPTPLTTDQLKRLQEAALAAPTARNNRELYFSFVCDRDLLQAISDTCRDLDPDLADVLKARSAGSIFYGAPTVVFITAEPLPYAFMDAGIAAQNIALAATAEGLGSCIIGLAAPAFANPNERRYYEAIGAGEGEVFQIAVALGWSDLEKTPHVPAWDRVRLIGDE